MRVLSNDAFHLLSDFLRAVPAKLFGGYVMASTMFL